MEQNIEKMNENGVLLTKILKISGYKGSVRKCRKLLHDQAPNIQGYLYRFKGSKFPLNFSYFFLNSILFKENRDDKGEKLSRRQNLNFIANNCKDLNILEKLLKPALDLHNLALINAANNIDKNYDEDLTDNFDYQVPGEDPKFIQDYIEEIIPGSKEIIKEYEEYDFDENNRSQQKVPTTKYTYYKKLVQSVRDLFPLMERMRKKLTINFVAPNECINVHFINTDNEPQIFSKSYLKDNLNINDLLSLRLFKVEDDEMSGSFEINDNLLIEYDPNLFKKKKEASSIENGVYLFFIYNQLLVRRLQFPLKSETGLDYFEIPKFLETEKIREIDAVFSGIPKSNDVTKLTKKYGFNDTYLRKKMSSIGIRWEKNENFYESLDEKIIVNVISDNIKYPIKSLPYSDMKIVGKVLWKSNNFDQNSYKFKTNVLPSLFEKNLDEDLEINPLFDYKEEKKLA